MNFYVIKESGHVYGGFGLGYDNITVAKAKSREQVIEEWHKIFKDMEKVSDVTYDLGNHTIELISIEEVYECEFNILKKYLPLHQISLS